MKKHIQRQPERAGRLIANKGYPSSRKAIVVAISAALMGGVSPGYAADEDNVKELEAVIVQDKIKPDTNPYAEPGAPYKAKISADERHKRDIADTAQNITILTETQIEDSGYTDLREILDAQPGITLGTGENGNAFGDRYIIRGQEARSDVFVDGLRDPGMTIRESFATEQVEISKGPNSSFAGRGTAGGAINSVTKQASTEYDFNKLSTGFGTDRYTRLTLDSNQALSEDVAVRANVLYGYEEVPNRAPADRSREGVALSSSWQASDKAALIVDYYGLNAEDTPDLGGFLTGTVPDREPADDVPVYAQEDDFQSSDVDILTARFRYDIQPTMWVTNATRKGSADNGYVVSGARYRTTDVTSPGGAYETISLSTHQGWQEVDYLANQTNLHWDTEISGKKHEFTFGLELANHQVLNGVYAITNTSNCLFPDGNDAGVDPDIGYCATDANGDAINGINTFMDRQIDKGNWDQDWQAVSKSLYLMDTVDLSDKWTVFAGLRRDYTDLKLKTQNATTQVQTGDYDTFNAMWNGHLGATYKFRPDANVYFSYARASDINGGESDVGTSAGYGGLVAYNGEAAGADPEVSQILEAGTKWNLMGGKLLATAAVFRIIKSDVMEGANYDIAGTFNTGKNQVKGVEFGLSGNITNKLMGQAGVAIMEAEVLKSFTEANEGKTLSNFADKTAYVQLRYQATPKFGFGGAAKYESEKFAGQPDTAAAYNVDGDYTQPIPAYTVFDLFANYQFNNDLDMRVNLGNVFDKEYYLAGYRSGSFLYLGDGRTMRVTLNYDF